MRKACRVIVSVSSKNSLASRRKSAQPDRMKIFRIALFLAIVSPGFAAEWIWSKKEDATFAKKFDLEAVPEAAQLTATGDFASVEIWINGVMIATLEAYDPVFQKDVVKALVKGENRIELATKGVDGPSAIAARLEIGELKIETDESWGDAAITKGLVKETRFAPNVLPDINKFAEYNQWREATADSEAQLSQLPDGYVVEVLRSAQEGEDSWVSMVFDAEGRIIIGKEKQGLLRLTLPKEDGGKIVAETIEETLKECRGLLWAYDSLYANANNSKGLYRLQDKNDDGRFGEDELELLKATEGSVGHGRNDLALGPDGKIYSIHGDVVAVGEDDKVLTPPEIEKPKFMGYVARMDKDGKNWEVLNRGLRNPYGIAFDSDGEMFTYDADNEGDVGLPLYRPTRVNHLVVGANYGWKQSADPNWSVPVWAPDTWPTTYDVGRGSPTSVKFGYGLYMPAPYPNALFVLDWSYGRIIALHLTPRGGSYYSTGEEFLRGRPLNVTDMEVGPDNAMYFITGGRKTQSALYRISFNQDVGGSPAPPTQQEDERQVYSAAARKLRKDLEGDPDVLTIWKNLGSQDPWIRGAARVAFERARAENRLGQSPLQALSNGGQPLAVLTAALAMARTGDDLKELPKYLDQLEIKTTTEKLTFLRAVEISKLSTHSVRERIESMYPDRDGRVNRELVKYLVHRSEAVVVKSLQLLADADNQFDRLHYLEQLSHAEFGWTPELRKQYFNGILYAKRFTSADRNFANYIKQIEERALANAPEAERGELQLLLAEDDADQIPPTPAREVVQHWKLADFADADLPAGDVEKGRQLYSEALCNRCHQFGALGKPVGPDLTTVASRFSREDLLKSIIEPSDVIADPYLNYLIQKKDGSTIIGRLIRDDFRKSALFISTNIFAPTQLTEVSKHDIDSYEPTPVSPMPPNLLDTLTKQEIADLLAFLEK